jgi:hypothetical protein
MNPPRLRPSPPRRHRPGPAQSARAAARAELCAEKRKTAADAYREALIRSSGGSTYPADAHLLHGLILERAAASFEKAFSQKVESAKLTGRPSAR